MMNRKCLMFCLIAACSELGCTFGGQRAIQQHFQANGHRQRRTGQWYRGDRDLHAVQPLTDNVGPDMVRPLSL